ncbi:MULTISPECIES: 2Fe-2S iron-sulfur cluster-binding protein [Brevibacillus]|uniref:Ferredoxin n=2 Tax=Bacillati TaxID=1783272 RepID=M8DJ67_9BACL|nr:2Fe-2S iron-sulfur cluster-binding protein [Brevibacillus borstelensis]EMT53608.1 ferredoxin [Brevibacillus borstelensis AK1]MBE5397783.1 (2Fe-2S)-binding protein [Brevibacillus borstelensis]MED1851050.1 2Fe-2S iron-sulfur cluster-binding protein [Brevibacillus borstelensis]MED1874923.1 2Fe-2S iron-sulfur cluster-binding protein [Brevibacillus borstelensis]WNF03689.1 2Fe-2S iron-sulfur cluster-binding protein [Brevibacillus borstelensis]
MKELTLHTRSGTHQMPLVMGKTIVAIAKEHKLSWGYACERGICAQCRTHVEAGAEHLNEITDAEKLRLRKAERAEGYRLGCQIKVIHEGNVTLAHRPY